MRKYFPSIFFLLCFVVFTVLIKTVDVQPLGPLDSEIGFATVNVAINNFTGIHPEWYTISNCVGVISGFIILGFALIGFIQLIKRKSILKVDSNILVLGVFYLVVFITFLIFEEVVALNYRPLLIDEELTASYPSSLTMAAICAFGSSMIELPVYVKKPSILMANKILSIILIVAIMAGRLISGYHWLTDIIGAGFLSLGLIYLYKAVRTNFVKDC
ncbi:MAG: phosphatase PAP2 family protein [Treponema sp.]|nr:phosphatase PAP2 family protein [Treponema sp.]